MVSETGFVYRSSVDLNHQVKDPSELEMLIGEWAAMLNGNLSKPELYAFLDGLENALNDEGMSSDLAKQGISLDTVFSLRAGLDGTAEFNDRSWLGVFRGLSGLVDTGEFGVADALLLKFGTYAAVQLLDQWEIAHDVTEKLEALLESKKMLAEMSFEEKSLGKLPTEFIEKLKEAGITADDVSNEKLKNILNGSGQADISFTVNEIDSIESELNVDGLDKALSLENDLLTHLQRIENLRVIVSELIASHRKTLGDALLEMGTKIGNS